MQLTPSDIYLHFKPSECDLRVYLKHQGIEGAEPSLYSEVLKRLGKRHELAHLATLGDLADLSESDGDVPTVESGERGGGRKWRPPTQAEVNNPPLASSR